MQVSDISVSTVLQVGAVVVGIALAWGASKAQDAAQDTRLAALERALDEAKERDEKAGRMARAWQRRADHNPACIVTPPCGQGAGGHVSTGR